MEEFESLAQQIEQMSKESITPDMEMELKQELPPYKISPQDVTNYRFDASKLPKTYSSTV